MNRRALCVALRAGVGCVLIGGGWAPVAGAGRIDGAVRDSAGTPIPWVFVDLYDADGLYFDFTATDQNGLYSFANLGTGEFYIHTDTLGAYVEEWYDDVPGAAEAVFFDPLSAGATAVSVAWYQWIVGKDFALSPAASVAGQVLDQGGLPVTNAYVDAYLPDGTRYATGLTDPDGMYHIGGLAAGSYAVRTDTQGGYIDEWQDGTPAYDVPAPAESGVSALTLAAAQDLAGVDFSLAGPGARLGGRVIHAGGEPVAGIYMDLTDPSGQRLEFDRTDDQGVFLLAGLPAGPYYLGTDGLGAYVDIWYEHRVMTDPHDPDGDGADLIALVDYETRTNLVLTLDQGAELSGVVRDEGGAPIAGVIVDAYLDKTWFDFALTDAAGAYRIPSLPDGAYYVKVDTFGDYLDEWYPDAIVLHLDDPALDGASRVVITQGVSVPGLDFALGSGAEMHGSVTETGGAPIADCYVDLYNGAGYRLFYTRTDSNGVYRLGGLPAGVYYLATDSQWRFVDEWYEDQVLLSRSDPAGNMAQPIDIAHRQVLTGIDFALLRGGSISGTVTGPDESPLPYAYVDLFLGTNSFDVAITDSNGVYHLTTLPAGTYYLRTDNAEELVNEWYGDVYIFRAGQPEEDGAAPVVLGPDEDRLGVDLALGWGGDVEGTVRDEFGTPLAGVFVDFFDASGRYYDYALTRDDGTFALEILPPGVWYLGTETFGDYQDEWYDDVPRSWVGNPGTDGASPILLEDGTVLVGIVIELARPLPLAAIAAISRTSTGSAVVEWMGEIDRIYQVERTEDLTVGTWTHAPSGPTEVEQSTKPAAAGLRQYTDPAPPASHAGYRVLAW